MQIKNFDDAFDILLNPTHEGGYSNNPADPGGETMYGVTKRVALEEGYLGPMKDLPIRLAKAIAKKRYWDKVWGDQYDPEVAFDVFDAIYNGGPAIRWIQSAAGTPVDGMMGAATVAAIRAANPQKLIMRFNADRIDYLAGLKIWPGFGKGWMRRIAANLREGAD